MVRVAPILVFFIFLTATSAEAKRRRIVLPPTTLSCQKECRQRIELEKTMDHIVAGTLVVCSYQDDKAIWVRKPKESGECRQVSVPRDQMKVTRKEMKRKGRRR
jgi:hypothetical protein